MLTDPDAPDRLQAQWHTMELEVCGEYDAVNTSRAGRSMEDLCEE